MESTTQLVVIIILILVMVWMLLIGRYWLRAMLSGIRLTSLQILFMRFRGSSVKVLLEQLIRAVKSGIVITMDDLEACSLAGGNPENVVSGLVYAANNDIELTIKEAMKIDSENRDIVNYLKRK